MMNLAEYRRTAARLADFLPWAALVGEGVILNKDGTINENGGKFAGLDRYKAREAVVTAMEELGFFESMEDRVIPLKFWTCPIIHPNV